MAIIRLDVAESRAFLEGVHRWMPRLGKDIQHDLISRYSPSHKGAGSHARLHNISQVLYFS